MSTNKPRIQAYIDSQLHQQFEQERSQWGISQSQALERMLAERYQSDIARDREVASDHDLMPLITSINELRLQVSNLEDELEERLLNKLESRFSSSLPSELPSKLPVKKESIDRLIPAGDSDSESELVTAELPSESELVTAELPSESELVTAELPSELGGESPSELPSELPQAELEKFVICEVDKQLNRYSFWAGNGRGFVGLLELAKRYKSENTIERPMKKILEDPDYSRFKEEPSRFELKYNAVRFFIKHSLSPSFKSNSHCRD